VKTGILARAYERVVCSWQAPGNTCTMDEVEDPARTFLRPHRFDPIG
jgi:hypothetical protein